MGPFVSDFLHVRFIHVVARVGLSFVRMSHIPLYG